MILIGRGLDQEMVRKLFGKCQLLFSFEGTLSKLNPVVIARRSHPFPSRTRKLSSLASTILGGQLPGKIERRRNEDTDEVNNRFVRVSYLRVLHILKQYEVNKETNKYSSLAQSVERMTVNHDVAGSSPARGAKITDIPKGMSVVFSYCAVVRNSVCKAHCCDGTVACNGS